jgi:hypothetical protein
MRIRLTVERSGDLEIEADVHVDVPVKELSHMSQDAVRDAARLLGELLIISRRPAP